jgi:hypothetical protein
MASAQKPLRREVWESLGLKCGIGEQQLVHERKLVTQGTISKKLKPAVMGRNKDLKPMSA